MISLKETGPEEDAVRCDVCGKFHRIMIEITSDQSDGCLIVGRKCARKLVNDLMWFVVRKEAS